MLLNLGVLLVALAGLWGVSVAIRNASIVDIFWGPACAMGAWLMVFRDGRAEPRASLIAILVTLWALRLAIYLAMRNIGHGEDARYQAMRRKRASDADFARWSLVYVFMLQGLLAWIVSWPVQIGQFGGSGDLGALEFFGMGLFAIGLAFETIGDFQLARFKANPENKGVLMTRGVWSWTRHPNYFGDACVWIGLAIIALGAPWGFVGLASPLIMTHLLHNISGKALTERSMEKRYPEYGAWRARTSGFFPLPPKK
jgi:steroid 5-alpha reductase family enzyme